MPDKLIKFLNEKGYQPVYMPATNYSPPDLYVFDRPRLKRMDALKKYLPKKMPLPENTRGELPDIQLTQTTEKSIKGALKFLGDILHSWGLKNSLGLDLSFAGDGDLVFSLVDVTYEETSFVEVTKLVQSIDETLIPEEYLKKGKLHVAYNYAYAAKLEMKKLDGSKFNGGINGVEVDNLMKLGVSGDVKVENGNTLVFNPSRKQRVAFAYKAGRIRSTGGKFELFPEDVARFAGGSEYDKNESAFYLPSPSMVLSVQDVSAGT